MQHEIISKWQAIKMCGASKYLNASASLRCLMLQHKPQRYNSHRQSRSTAFRVNVAFNEQPTFLHFSLVKVAHSVQSVYGYIKLLIILVAMEMLFALKSGAGWPYYSIISDMVIVLWQRSSMRMQYHQSEAKRMPKGAIQRLIYTLTMCRNNIPASDILLPFYILIFIHSAKPNIYEDCNFMAIWWAFACWTANKQRNVMMV